MGRRERRGRLQSRTDVSELVQGARMERLSFRRRNCSNIGESPPSLAQMKVRSKLIYNPVRLPILRHPLHLHPQRLPNPLPNMSSRPPHRRLLPLPRLRDKPPPRRNHQRRRRAPHPRPPRPRSTTPALRRGHRLDLPARGSG